MSDETQNPLRDAIEDAITTNPVILFMKGTPEQPMCGFSARTVGALQALEAPFAAVDILPDPRIRQELSALSNWPTIPQLFVKGELVGGCDIVIEMYESGELAELLGVEQPATPSRRRPPRPRRPRRCRSRTASAEPPMSPASRASRPTAGLAHAAARRRLPAPTTRPRAPVDPHLRAADRRTASAAELRAHAVPARRALRSARAPRASTARPPPGRRRTGPRAARTVPVPPSDVDRRSDEAQRAGPGRTPRGIRNVQRSVRSGPRSSRTRSATRTRCPGRTDAVRDPRARGSSPAAGRARPRRDVDRASGAAPEARVADQVERGARRRRPSTSRAAAVVRASLLRDMALADAQRTLQLAHVDRRQRRRSPARAPRRRRS